MTVGELIAVLKNVDKSSKIYAKMQYDDSNLEIDSILEQKQIHPDGCYSEDNKLVLVISD